MRKDYNGDGVIIDLETSFKPYTNLIDNHYKYLDKSKKYYFYCYQGITSTKVARILEAYGYDANVIR